MKLPKGKIVATYEPTERSLLDIIAELKDDAFDGYIKIVTDPADADADTDTDTDTQINGYLVYQEGALVLTIFEGEKKSFGADALRPVLRSALDRTAIYELHGSVDTSLMVLYFPKAKLDETEFDIAAIYTEEEEAEQKRREFEEQKDQFLTHIEHWKEQGYSVTRVEKVLEKKDFDLLRESFMEFQDDIDQLKEYDEKLDAVDVEKYGDEVASIRDMLHDPDRLDKIREEYGALEELIETEELRRNALRQKIDQWREEGYNVARVEDAVEGNLDDAWDAFTGYTEDMERLTEFEERLDELDVYGHDDIVAKITERLKDPDAIDAIDAAFEELDEALAKDEARKSELKEQVERWAEEGFNTAPLDGIFEEPLPMIEEAVDEYRAALKRGRELTAMLEALDTTYFESEREEILAQMKDPARYDEIGSRLDELEDAIEADRARREEVRALVEEYRDAGYRTGSLEEALEADLDELNATVEQYREGIDRLDTLKAELEELEVIGHEDEVAAITELLDGPGLADTAREKLETLQRVLEEEAEKREELKKRVDTWREEGYNVSRLEESLKAPMGELWETFTGYMDDLQQLSEYRERYDALEFRGHEEERERLERLLNDPDALDELETAYRSLAETIEREEQERDEVKAQLLEWASEGIDVSSMQEVINDAFAVLAEQFGIFSAKVQRLERCRNEFETLTIIGHEDEVGSIESKLDDPHRVEALEEEVEALKTTLEEEAARRDEIKSTVESWREEGYNVERFDDVLDEPMEQLEALYEQYRSDLETLAKYRERLEALDTKWHEEEAEQLENVLMNPELLDEIAARLEELESTIEAESAKRDQFRSQVTNWNEAGYNVEKIEAVLDDRLDTIWELIAEYMDRIQELEELQERFDSLTIIGHEGEVESITAKLKDPEQLEPLREELERFEEELREEGLKRAELAKRIEEWREDGINVQRLEAVLQEPIDTL